MNIYEQQAIDSEIDILNNKSRQSNLDQTDLMVKKRIVNLSLVEIAANISITIIDIINDLLDPTKPKNIRDIITIFFQGDRMVYIGIIFVFLSLGLYFIDISS